MSGSGKLIIGIDVGTRLSAVSYVFVPSGESVAIGPIQHVTGWPGITASAQREGGMTVPSLMYYSEDGRIKYGYHADQVARMADYKPRLLVKEFKRAVHRLGTNNVPFVAGSPFDRALEESDAGITLKDVYTEWLKFLIRQATPQISKKYSAKLGQEWSSIWSKRTVVLVIPNGWGIPEQATLRNALIEAKGIEEGLNVRFIVESEVALHAAKGVRRFDPKKGDDFMVCDAGAATADIALYTVTSETPFRVQEVRNHPSISVEAGLALAVEKVEDGNYVAENDSDTFDQTGGTSTVDEPAEAQHSEFTEALNNEFSRVIAAIKETRGTRQPKYLILGGGLPSKYTADFKARLISETGMEVLSRTHNVTKSADGAVECYLEKVVEARASPYSYGITIQTRYNSSSPMHSGRRIAARRADGDFVNCAWSEVVPYGFILKEGEPRNMDYYWWWTHPSPDLSDMKVTIYAADHGKAQEFVFDKDEKTMLSGFKELCIIQMNLSELNGKLEVMKIKSTTYYKLDFKVEITFVSSRPQASVIWKGSGGQGRSIPVNLEDPDGWENVGSDLAKEH